MFYETAYGLRTELTVTPFSAALSTGLVPCNSVEKLYQKNVNYSTSACHGKLILVQHLPFHNWQRKQTNKQHNNNNNNNNNNIFASPKVGWDGVGRGGEGEEVSWTHPSVPASNNLLNSSSTNNKGTQKVRDNKNRNWKSYGQALSYQRQEFCFLAANSSASWRCPRLSCISSSASRP